MKKNIRDIDIAGKKVIVRCDFNVPMKDGAITDDIRIRAALPTIEYLLEEGCALILMSHMGRPKGEPKMEYTLKPVADRLTELLARKVRFISSPIVVDDEVRKAAEDLKGGEVMLLENVRFVKGETDNDAGFAKALASLAEVFVNDAFGTAHRAHSSTAGIADYLPAVSGFLIEKEIRFLGDAMESPERPFVAIMGGAKVGDKIPVIENLMNKVDSLIIGGGMAYTFYKAMGYETGTSILDRDSVEIAAGIMKKAEETGVNLVLPLDCVCTEEFSNDSPYEVYDRDKIPADKMGMDIGPKSAELFESVLRDAKQSYGTDLWVYLKWRILQRELMLLQRFLLNLMPLP